MARHHFADLTVDAPDAWRELGAKGPNPAFGLSPDGGGTVLQLTVATYAKGQRPDPSSDALLDMAIGIGAANDLHLPTDMAEETLGDLRIGAASFQHPQRRVRVWVLSNGWSVAMLTFLGPPASAARWLPECEAIARSARFDPPAS